MYRGEDDGISWDHDDYTPHVTITYDAGDLNIDEVEPYTGELRFGPEIFEEIKVSFDPDTLKEKKLSDVQLTAAIIDAFKTMPTPQVAVTVQVPDSPAPRRVKKRTRVIERDSRGRPDVTETTETEE
jgi:hypothetical protein